MTLLDTDMAKRKPAAHSMADGDLLAANLIRLGYADTVVRTTEVAKLVTEKTGKSMSRQRISSMLNAIHIRPETIQLIAKGLGVKPEELTRKPKD